MKRRIHKKKKKFKHAFTVCCEQIIKSKQNKNYELSIHNKEIKWRNEKFIKLMDLQKIHWRRTRKN